MAIAHKHVTSWTMDQISQTVAERISLNLPTLVLDRRVVSEEGGREDLLVEVVSSQFCTNVDLADASRWFALIVPRAEGSRFDLESFARALASWCVPPRGPTADCTPEFPKTLGSPRITQIIKALYDPYPGSAGESISDEVIRHWRSILRDLGEGPSAIIDDPWFSHLFLSPTAAELPLAQPCTMLDLRSPRVPRRAAHQITNVVFDRLLERGGHHDSTAELLCFILEGADLESVLQVPAAPSSTTSIDFLPNVQFIWIDEVKDYSEVRKFAFETSEISTNAEDDSGALYRTFSVNMDKRHRAAYVKGLMYGYSAFCTFEKSEQLPDDLVFLQEAGLILGMSSPLVQLFDDC